MENKVRIIIPESQGNIIKTPINYLNLLTNLIHDCQKRVSYISTEDKIKHSS